jgi:dipeptidyl aminopeptidase/acylaminoacyl peptidase
LIGFFSVCFVHFVANDSAVKVENSLAFATALSKAKVPFALHVFENGRHGLGLASKPPYKDAHPWAGDLIYWLHQRKFLDKSK